MSGHGWWIGRDERDALVAIEGQRIAIRRACALFLKHNAFCECQGCTDIALRLAPPPKPHTPNDSETTEAQP